MIDLWHATKYVVIIVNKSGMIKWCPSQLYHAMHVGHKIAVSNNVGHNRVASINVGHARVVSINVGHARVVSNNVCHDIFVSINEVMI